MNTTSTIDELNALHDDLVGRMERIDVVRAQYKTLIVERNRQPGVSKETIARLQQKRAKLLEARGQVRAELVKVNDAIRARNRAENNEKRNDPTSSAGPVTLAQRFVEVVRAAVPRAQFREWMEKARVP